MKLRIEDHPNYQALTPEKSMFLWMSARYKLRVGMELEYGDSERRGDPTNPTEAMDKIKNIFKQKYGFECAIGKGTMSKKVRKRTFQDMSTGATMQVDDAIEVDGFKEHVIAPYMYNDGSVPVEVVMSPEILVVENIARKIEKIDKAVEQADINLIQSPLFSCGLHQTVLFDHLEHDIPNIVVVNTAQIVRTYMAGLVFLSASGTIAEPTRGTGHRGFMRSPWLSQGIHYPKYCLIYPRFKNGDKCWGIEFRYPDGTNSRALAGAIAILNASIIFKAISLSKFGVLKISESTYRESKSLVEKFINGNMENQDWENIKEQATQLISFLADEITEVDPQAYYILEKVKEKPVFTLARDVAEVKRETYKSFDRILSEMPKQDGKTIELAKHIELDNTMGLKIRDAKKRLARKVKVKYSDITELLDKSHIVWDPGLEKFVRVPTELFEL